MAKGRKLDFSLPRALGTQIISHHLKLNILSLSKSHPKLTIWKPLVSSPSHITSEQSADPALPIPLLCSEFFLRLLLRLLDGCPPFSTWVTLYLGPAGLLYAPSIDSLQSPPSLLPQGCHPAFLLTMHPPPGTGLVAKPKPFKETSRSFVNLFSLISITFQFPWLDPCESLAVPEWVILSFSLVLHLLFLPSGMSFKPSPSG